MISHLYLKHSLSFVILVTDLIVVAFPTLHNMSTHLARLLPTSCFSLYSLLPLLWGPCLLPDRKLLYIITLLKSQFTQPQQIILQWMPGVMETVFSTLHPAPLLLCQNYTKCLSPMVKKPFLPIFLLHILPFFIPLSYIPLSFLVTCFTFSLPFALCSLCSNQKDSSVSPQAVVTCC